MAKTPLTNITAQEAVVKALWEFAWQIQTNPAVPPVAVSSREQTLSLTHVGNTLQEIMEAFGYEVAEVQ